MSGRASIALLVDYANLRQGVSDSDGATESASEGVSDGGVSDGGVSDGGVSDGGSATRNTASGSDVARALVKFASGGGRVGLARAYADWTRDPEGARDLTGTRIEPVMVPATEDGEDRSHIRLVVDAMAAANNGSHPDAYVLVSGDPTLVPLAQALRAAGSDVIVVAPEGTAHELAAEADVCVALADVVEGKLLDPVAPRGSNEARPSPRQDRDTGDRQQGDRNYGGRQERGYGDRQETGRDQDRSGAGRGDRRVPYFDPGRGAEPDFSTYEWQHFVRLIDELEDRLPFVGVRYLVNKVLGPHNCGIDDPRLKRDLINQAVDEGIIELYTVGNVDDRLDPVTACRLDRANDLVLAEIGAGNLEDDEDFEPFEEDISTPARPASSEA